MESEIINLKSELDKSEQYSRRNSLRVWTNNLERNGEDTDQIILDHAQKLGASLSTEEIDRSHRVGRPRGRHGGHKPRAIIVKLATYRSRQNVYKNRRRDRNIYISEDLTKISSNLGLLFIARKLRRANAIKSCYSRDGRIYIRELNPCCEGREGSEVEIRALKGLDKMP